ncbi:FKBP-type peptidyl-prolyl cis-trans isomerase [Candidatus Saccharibacteria bacterium]|nr:FKBP-type peptidyl-prolyl cis-trans isomerase [Candidatus Saccharibacteria bacterium]
MEEKELKTSKGQRVAIGLIAFIMLGSIIASYAAIIVGNSSANSSEKGLSEERLAYYQNQYSEQVKKFKEISASDYAKFSPYLSEVKAYNETNANEGGVQVKDLAAGTGKTLEGKDGDYLAYYVGWCADEKIFDSSLDSETKPTAFVKALDVSAGMIEGWYQGVSGMKLGGIREFTIPGELAYGDKMEICGGYNKPLKFLVMAVPAEDPLKTAAADLDVAYLELQYANAGIDYEKEVSSAKE